MTAAVPGDSTDSADSAPLPKNNIFCHTIVKVADSADSAVFGWVMVTDSVVMKAGGSAAPGTPSCILATSPHDFAHVLGHTARQLHGHPSPPILL